MQSAKFSTSALWMIGLMAALLCGAAPRAHAGEIAFPGATTTTVTGNNDNNDLTGFYIDANLVQHGFYRIGASGTLTSFDCPHAKKTTAKKITEEGKPPTPFITGDYVDQNNKSHGFKYNVNTKTCEVWEFQKQPTEARGANIKGMSVGDAVDGSDKVHGFFRTKKGKMREIVEPNAQNNVFPRDINDKGMIAGTYDDTHGFAYDSVTWSVTEIACPGAGFTVPAAIDGAGNIAGVCGPLNQPGQGFVRDAQGNFTLFQPTGAKATLVTGMNKRGDIVGYFQDKNGVYRGFLRHRSGRIKKFDFVGATYTIPQAVNDSLVATGAYYDAGFNERSFEMQVP